jgi:uncharacterized protein YkwD
MKKMNFNFKFNLWGLFFVIVMTSVLTAASIQINNYEPAVKTFKVGQKIYDLYQEVSRLRKSQNQNDLVLSPPLTLTAESYLKHHLSLRSQNISLKQLNYFGSLSGNILPGLHPYLIEQSPGQTVIDDKFKEMLRDLQATDMGIAQFVDPQTKNIFTLFVFAKRSLSLNALPIKIKPGQKQILTGALSVKLNKPQVWLTPPSGIVKEVKVITRENHFSGSFTPGTAGVYQVEVTAVGNLGPEVIALFPVYVGMTPKLPLSEAPDPKKDLTLEEAETYLFELLNQARQKYKLPPLKWNEALQQVARRHSNEMVDKDYFAHISPITGYDNSKRLEEAGIDYISSAENLGYGQSVIGIHEGLMESPGHRQNILDNYTEGGIGMAIKKINGVNYYYATQIFLNGSQSVTPELLRNQIFDQINTYARGKGRPVFKKIAALDQIAQSEAELLGKQDPVTLDGYQMSNFSDKAKGISYRKARTILLRVKGGQEIEMDPEYLNNLYDTIGIGVYQGTSQFGGPNTVWVFMVFIGN